jgi:hypothetical protein
MAAEYIAISTASDDGMLLLKLFEHLRITVRPILLLCDNVAATKVLPNPVENTKMKYLDIHYMWCEKELLLVTSMCIG